MFGERETAVDINRVTRSEVDIPMPRDYQGPARFEAGHCTWSQDRGTRSEVVMTPEFFRIANQEEQVRIVIHEFSHAKGWLNSDIMTPEHRQAIVSALRRVLSKGRTVYDYPDDYPNEALRMEELFAEFMAHTALFRPLAPDDPLRQLPLRERMRMRFAQIYSVSLDVADAYAQLAEAVAHWQESDDYFERVQSGVNQLVNQLVVEGYERRRAAFREGRSREIDRVLRGVHNEELRRIMSEVAHRPEFTNEQVARTQRMNRVRHAYGRMLSRLQQHDRDFEITIREQGIIRAAVQDMDHAIASRFDTDFVGVRPEWTYHWLRLDPYFRQLDERLRALGMAVDEQSVEAQGRGVHSVVDQVNAVLTAARTQFHDPEQYREFLQAVYRRAHTIFTHDEERIAAERAPLLERADEIASNTDLFPRFEP